MCLPWVAVTFICSENFIIGAAGGVDRLEVAGVPAAGLRIPRVDLGWGRRPSTA